MSKNNAKKIVALLVAVALVSTACIGLLIGCKSEEPFEKVRVANENLYANNLEYIDYAEEVKFDLEAHPELEKMGLFWLEWNETTKKQVEYSAETDKGASLVDPNKPTIIMVHGMLGSGYHSLESFYLNSNVADPNEFDLPDDYKNISLARLWQLKGWNVGYYHYAKFAVPGESAEFTEIERRIWTRGTNFKGISYRNSAKNLVEEATPYSVAEHFAADYIRAMAKLPSNMGNKEIRLAAHSMGGELTVAGLFLLTELADVGQIAFKKLPARFTLLDPFFSFNVEIKGNNVYGGIKDCYISWSSKKLIENTVTDTMLDCIRDIAANGIIVEYIAFKDSFLRAFLNRIEKDLIKEVVYVIGYPNYSGLSDKYDFTNDSHNAIRDWYFCSIMSEPAANITEGMPAGSIAVSASTPTDVLRTLKGKVFYMKEGSETVGAYDDKFIEVDISVVNS